MSSSILSVGTIHQKIKNLFRSGLSSLPVALGWKQVACIGLPVLLTLFILAGLIYNARISDAQTPSVKNGVLDLTEWNGEKTFGITGEWEFYWGKLLSNKQIKNVGQTPMLVDAPDKWNNYRINGIGLPGKGHATYRIHVIGAEAGKQYGARIQDMASAYRFYIDDVLVASNGNFRDNEAAPSSAYRPQLAVFTPTSASFDMVLQVSNDVYGIGGMWDPIIFGDYSQIVAFDWLLFYVITFATAGLVVSCIFFLIFFAAQRGEKDALILSILSVLILLRLSIIGDVILTRIFPNLPIVWLNWIDFLTMPWAQFLLLYFIYCAYCRLVPKWQVTALLIYTVAVSLFILLFPLESTTSAYMLMNYILLVVTFVVTAQLTRAAWQGREGASLLLFAKLLILTLICYKMFVPDRSMGYYLLNNSGFEYLVFIFAYMAVVALRYRHAQALEIAHLKGQIRPHFIHNSLTSIISISRNDPERSRDLLVDFSSYLRGFYDYERDEMISFTLELELVRSYIALEQARFGGKYRVEYQIEVEDFFLPPLLLQPLVENAFVHGLREKDNGGTVIVYTRRMKNGRVRVGVRDDGLGMSLEHAQPRRGVGIENINRRLSRLYRTSLIYLVPEDGGCEVYLEIPYREAHKYEGMVD